MNIYGIYSEDELPILVLLEQNFIDEGQDLEVIGSRLNANSDRRYACILFCPFSGEGYAYVPHN